LRGIFYATQENTLTLKEFLGDFYQELKKLSSYMTSIHHKEQYSIKANWKTNIENALESYHVAHIHEATFVGIMDLNPKAGSEHFQKYHSSWETNLEEKTASKIKKMEKIFSLENFPVAGYKHYFIFPNLAIATTSGFSFGIQIYNPTTENTTDFIHLVIAPQNKNQALAKHFLDAVTQFNSTVFKEDCAICEQVQINLSSQKEPFYYSELFEKRLIHFQQNLKDILL
jgi:phenylpropionate dioxygenase-like ring-hydroxylating dioxygenase large terminal subunit